MAHARRVHVEHSVHDRIQVEQVEAGAEHAVRLMPLPRGTFRIRGPPPHVEQERIVRRINLTVDELARQLGPLPRLQGVHVRFRHILFRDGSQCRNRGQTFPVEPDDACIRQQFAHDARIQRQRLVRQIMAGTGFDDTPRVRTQWSRGRILPVEYVRMVGAFELAQQAGRGPEHGGRRVHVQRLRLIRVQQPVEKAGHDSSRSLICCSSFPQVFA